MLDMVVGFLFDAMGEKVLLIEKNRPAWQAGRLNGPGGKLDYWDGGSPIKAMRREFYQETMQKVETTPGISDFKHFVTLNGSGYRVYFFYAHVELLLEKKDNPTDEKQIIAKVNNLPDNVLPNLRWLIPMALDKTLLRPTIIYDKTSDGKVIWSDE